ncbi:MAG: ribonuclease HIII, partial [Melioribacteraceae bacterium]
GERFIGVAAASILARNAMNLWFEKQKTNGIILPKGASLEVEQKAKKIKNEFGEKKLAELAKLHFKTLQKIK